MSTGDHRRNTEVVVAREEYDNAEHALSKVWVFLYHWGQKAEAHGASAWWPRKSSLIRQAVRLRMSLSVCRVEGSGA